MNPWYGLWTVIGVCCMVIVVLFIGKFKYEASLGREITGDGVTSAPTGFNKPNTIPSDNKLRF